MKNKDNFDIFKNFIKNFIFTIISSEAIFFFLKLLSHRKKKKSLR